ncbi:hypothetical protein ACNQGP_15195 [Flavobacterium sp. GT2N3]|uniref:hypothetical protein n=1 Tax=unclassified Flavobacterium TaxID=196869 RepID=UPI003AADCDFB
MTEQFRNFYGNWLGKADAYNGNTLSNHFDKFTSLYVVYNSLYMEVTTELMKNGSNVTHNFKDKTAATEYVMRYLKPTFYHENLLNDEQSINDLAEICTIIDQELFHIILDWGIPQRIRDLQLLDSLRSDNTNKQVRAVLSLFYYIRCNLFHGHKGFEDRQSLLLIPVNHLLRKTIEITYNKLNRVQL